MSDLSRRDLLRSAAAIGVAAGVPQVLARPAEAPEPVRELTATLCWLGDEPARNEPERRAVPPRHRCP